LCGDADHLVGLAGFLVELGMLPIHIVSAAQGRRTTARLRQVLAPVRHPIKMKVPGDPAQLGPWIHQEPVDLIMGGASCAELARSAGMALVRFGFSGADPARDPGSQHLGYRGGLRLLEQILDGLMPGQAWASPEEPIRQVM
jgi:nitrogenase molybdenum-iron protein beta chain